MTIFINESLYYGLRFRVVLGVTCNMYYEINIKITKLFEKIHCCSIRRFYNFIYLSYMYNLDCINNKYNCISSFFTERGLSITSCLCKQ